MAKSNKQKVQDWRQRTKERIIEAMGGKCVCCNYRKCQAALTLHHLDPSKKEMSFASLRANPVKWIKIVEELRKCVLVCANCHAEIEYDGRQIPKDCNRFDESYTTYSMPKSHLLI